MNSDGLTCAVVSAAKILAADPLSPISCEVGHPWIRLGSGHPTGAISN